MVFDLLSGIPDDLPNAQEGFNPHSDKFRSMYEGDTSGKSFKRLHRYRYSPTVCYGNNEVHLHPWEDRRLTVRESMRIQGIPDNYALPEEVPLSAKFKMIGNGVPVPLAELVARSLFKFLTPLIL
jgi:DNA (cytosine-5)-methyltransferase 1